MANHIEETLTGERALFKTRDAYIERCRFEDGESPLKESRDIDVVNCTFAWKYPLWYCKGVNVIDSLFDTTSRAGVWYTKDAHFSHCDFKGPKFFRKCDGISIEDAEFSDGEETFWWNKNVTITDAVVQNAPYFCMGTKSLEIDHLDLHGNYAFDGCRDVVIRNSVLRTKDAFWNCKNVRAENCYIEGEYFGWNSENVTLVHCEIRSHQGFCYMKNVTLIDCRLVDTDLAFEYCSDIDVDVVTSIDSVKNPISGKIRCTGIGELIFDDPKVDPKATEIVYGE